MMELNMMPRFFVMHLSEQDLTRKQLTSDKGYQIQLLDSQGRAIAVGYVGPDDESLEIADFQVPKSVIEAAHRQPVGQGDYVNERGMTIQPF